MPKFIIWQRGWETSLFKLGIGSKVSDYIKWVCNSSAGRP